MIIAALVVSWAAFYVPYYKNRPEKLNRVMEIKDAASGRIYGQWPLEEGEEFAIEFIHSVNQSPVREGYANESGIIRLRFVRFHSFGAGMLSDLEGGLELKRDGDAMIITGFSTSFKVLNYIVGTVSDHLLFIRNEIVSLREFCGRNAQINIYLK